MLAVRRKGHHTGNKGFASCIPHGSSLVTDHVVNGCGCKLTHKLTGTPVLKKGIMSLIRTGYG